MENPLAEEWRGLAEMRLKEAQYLLAGGFYDGAYYLGGYVIESALKACICKKLCFKSYPPSNKTEFKFKTHRLDDLVLLAGLRGKIDNAVDTNENFATNWQLVLQWSEQERYKSIGLNNQQRTSDFLAAIGHKQHGVLAWLKKRW